MWPQTRLDNWTFSDPEIVTDADGNAVYQVIGTERAVIEYHGTPAMRLDSPSSLSSAQVQPTETR